MATIADRATLRYALLRSDTANRFTHLRAPGARRAPIRAPPSPTDALDRKGWCCRHASR